MYRKAHNGETAKHISKGYKTAYLHKMYSPDPRNVKITYRGVDLSGDLTNAVSISGVSGEGQNVMVYYKTIEKYQVGEDAPYAYTLIPNPFSKRPKSEEGTYYGFAGYFFDIYSN